MFWKEWGKDAEWLGRQTWPQLRFYLDSMKEKKTYHTMAEAAAAGLKRGRQ